MRQFYRDNKKLLIILCIAVFIMLSYLASLDVPEWFYHANDWYNLLYNISIGYCVSFIFYLMQVYFPSAKRRNHLNKLIKKKVSEIVDDMKTLINHMLDTVYEVRPYEPYTPELLDELLKISSCEK